MEKNNLFLRHCVLPSPIDILRLQNITECCCRMVNTASSYRVLSDSNLNPQTGYFDKGFLLIFSVPLGKFPGNTINQATTASSHILSNSLFINQAIIILRYVGLTNIGL
jgi:hypothetical protein